MKQIWVVDSSLWLDKDSYTHVYIITYLNQNTDDMLIYYYN